MDNLVSGTERENIFLREYFASLFAYSANRVPEIADQYYSIDDAMRAGYISSTRQSQALMVSSYLMPSETEHP